MQNVLTLTAFAEWCEKKPPEQRYIWHRADACACAQYADYLGIDAWWLAGNVYDQTTGHKNNFWSQADMIAKRSYPHTFGALARRLRQAA